MSWRKVIPKKVDHEHRHQCTIVEWATSMRYKYPELAMLYAVPNGGHRNKAVAAKLKREGVKPGQPDLTLPVARRGFHALYIELKVPKTPVSEKTYPTKLQRAVGRALAAEGNLAVVCWGQDATIKVLEFYLEPHLAMNMAMSRKETEAYLNSLENVEVLQAA